MSTSLNTFRSHRRSAAGLVLVALVLTLLLCGCHRSQVKLDYSSPKSIAITWNQAMRAGDAAAMKAASVNADPALIDAFARVVRAHAALVNAATDKFGEPARKFFNSASFVPDNSAQINSAKIAEKAGAATLSYAGDVQMRFKKADGKWKVDCAADRLFAQSPDSADQLASRNAVADVDQQLADGIKSGKYAVLEEATSARMKLIAASMSPK